jgi:hypothetical protein
MRLLALVKNLDTERGACPPLGLPIDVPPAREPSPWQKTVIRGGLLRT